MGKSRAEIQKAYRERQKEKGPAFLLKERERAKQNYIPADQLSTRKKSQRNENAKLRNRLCRLKKKLNQEQNIQTEGETSGYCSIGSPRSPDSLHTDSDDNNIMRVKLPAFSSRKSTGLKKTRARALSKANRTISGLKLKIMDLKRKVATKDRQLRRNKNKTRTMPTLPETPRRQTHAEIDNLNISPHSRTVVRKKLLLANVVMSEIRASRVATKSKERKMLHHIVAGRVVKKYKCMQNLSKATGFCRRAMGKCNTKKHVSCRESRNCLSRLVKPKVLDFLMREDNSRMQPGKADATRKGKVQLMVLTDYLKNLHLKFSAENPDVKISLATFCRLRPKHILLAAFISRNACQCLRHQNMALKVQALRKSGIKLSENPEALLRHDQEIDDLLQSLPDVIVYRVWKRIQLDNGVNKMKVVEMKANHDIFCNDFKKELQEFSEHVSRVRQQYHELHTLKEKLPEHEMILQMDFAENFACRSVDEVQSAYWNQTSVTIHPVVAYWMQSGKLQHRSFVVVSDVASHSPSTVLAFIDAIMPSLRSLDNQLKKIHYWTDSPSSQYRNRFIFKLVAEHKEQYGASATWNYFEAGHGKGPCDGLGGTTKRLADEAIRQGKTSIQDAKEFFQWAQQSSMTGVTFIYVSKCTCDDKLAHLKTQTHKPVKNTMKLHAVAGCGPHHLKTRVTSCYCDKCLAGEFCASWTEHQFNPALQQNTHRVRTDGALDKTPDVTQRVQSFDIAEASTTQSEVDVEDELSGEANDNANVIPDHIFTQLKTQDYVAAVYDGEWFVGVINEMDHNEGDCEVNFMQHAKGLFKWPTRPDAVWIDKGDIICKLHPLMPTGKSERLFKLQDGDKDMIESAMKKM